MQVKACLKCGASKLFSEFNKKASNSDGLATRCRACNNIESKKWYSENTERSLTKNREWLKENPEKRAAIKKAWRDKNPEKMDARNIARRGKNLVERAIKSKEWRLANPGRSEALAKAWRLANPEKVKEYQKAWNAENPDKINFHSAVRRARKELAVPAWANLSAIKAFYDKAKQLERETGIKHHVDHKIPLRHKLVCGLHVENNLQILTASENLKKKNSFKI